MVWDAGSQRARLSLAKAIANVPGRTDYLRADDRCTHGYGLSVPGLDKLSEGFSPTPSYLGLVWVGFPTPPYFQPPLIFLSEGFVPSPPYLGSGELGFSTPSYFLSDGFVPSPP